MLLCVCAGRRSERIDGEKRSRARLPLSKRGGRGRARAALPEAPRSHSPAWRTPVVQKGSARKGLLLSRQEGEGGGGRRCRLFLERALVEEGGGSSVDARAQFVQQFQASIQREEGAGVKSDRATETVV